MKIFPRPRYFARFVTFLAVGITSAAMADTVISITNNQAFDVRQPMLVRVAKVADSAVAQQVGSDAMVLVDAAAKATIKPLEAGARTVASPGPQVAPVENG